METIDITPTWEAVVRICIHAIKNPDTPDSVKQDCEDELLRLARFVDAQQEKKL